MSAFSDEVTIGYWTTRGLGAPLRMMAAYAAATKGASYKFAYHDMAETAERKAGTADPADYFGNWCQDGWLETKTNLLAKNPLANLPYVKERALLLLPLLLRPRLSCRRYHYSITTITEYGRPSYYDHHHHHHHHYYY